MDAASPYLPSGASQSEQDVEEAEYLRAQEEWELQQMIASMEESQETDNSSQHYGSDDEDYDEILKEVLSAADGQQPHSNQEHSQSTSYPADMDEMDMS